MYYVTPTVTLDLGFCGLELWGGDGNPGTAKPGGRGPSTIELLGLGIVLFPLHILYTL